MISSVPLSPDDREWDACLNDRVFFSGHFIAMLYQDQALGEPFLKILQRFGLSAGGLPAPMWD